MMSRAYPLAFAASALLIASTAPALCQASFGSGRPGRIAPHPQSQYQPSPGLTHSAPEPWPRLDPGAVLCGSADQLQQRATAIKAAIDGKDRALMTPGCTMLQARTPVDVVDRSTLGRTEVKVRATGQIGWTDVWLPERAPSG